MHFYTRKLGAASQIQRLGGTATKHGTKARKSNITKQTDLRYHLRSN